MALRRTPKESKSPYTLKRYQRLGKTAMTLSLNCKDAGDPVCTHTMYGETEEELLQNAKKHGIEVHGYTEETWNEEIAKNGDHFRKLMIAGTPLFCADEKLNRRNPRTNLIRAKSRVVLTKNIEGSLLCSTASTT